MMELIINKEKDIETICIVKDGNLVEQYCNSEAITHRKLEGNIYAGRVVDIIPGMQSAFIDYGEERNGFLHIKDAIPQIDITTTNIDEKQNIKDILKPNQKLLIQIKKDSTDKKGSKISTHITLPNRYVVFMPNTEIITISKKIPEGERKKELLKLARENLPSGNGIVIRTSAESAKNEEIVKDIEICLKKWENILKKYNNCKTQGLLYESERIQEKALLDINFDRVLTNRKDEFDKIKNLLILKDIKNVKLELKNFDLHSMYELDNQIEKTKERKIWLNCGGFITIDKTEALTAIDVNTGKFTGKDNLDETIFKVNKEATIEIAKQLRLRDIGGIIIIDYIDMKDLNNKKVIKNLLEEELSKDRAKTQVSGFTALNLMEVTRQHICSHLSYN